MAAQRLSIEPESVELFPHGWLQAGETIGGSNEYDLPCAGQGDGPQHLDKERTLAPLGVKVLSLFFVDKVANYRATDDDGNPTLGPIGQWFEEAYVDLASKPRCGALLPPVVAVHDGYFSVDNKGRAKDTWRQRSRCRHLRPHHAKQGAAAVRRKEPLRFIFSHSALREGWDNPNMFQICTLNDSRSADRKRQEIGRGLRLPVNQDGERIHDPLVNRLTVVANEAYDEFARALQTEYEEDTGQRFGIVPKHTFAWLTLPSGPGSRRELPSGRSSPAKSGTTSRPLGTSILWGRPPEVRSVRGGLRARTSLTASSRSGPRSPTPSPGSCSRTASVNAKRRQSVRFRKQVSLDPDFKALWDRISKRTKYRVSLSSDDLVAAASADHRC